MNSILVFILCTLAVVYADQSNGLCKDKPSPRFIRDLDECQKYYTCINGVGIANECPEGLYFDEENQWCDRVEKVKCSMKPAICPPDEVAYIEMEGHCDKYYICLSGKAYQQPCATGMWFDKERQVCDEIDKVNCNACPMEDNPIYPVYLPNKKDCGKYYICLDRQMVPFDCAPGFHFDVTVGTCVVPEFSECKYSTLFDKEIVPMELLQL